MTTQDPLGGRSAIDQQIIALLHEKERLRLAAGAAAGNRAEDHLPVNQQNNLGGNWRHLLSCSCGWHPSKPHTRFSTMHVPYMNHLRKLGLPIPDTFYVTYGYGPAKGLTWDEAKARGIEP